MTPGRKKAILDQLDRAESEYAALRAKSQYEDSSDQPEREITKLNILLGSTIERVAPPGSRYRTEAERILKTWSATNAVCLKYLPGIIAALRSDVEGDYLQSISELIHGDVFSDFLGMAEYLLDEAYKEAAAVLIGGVLEEQLRKLASKHGIAVVTGSRPIKADRLNADLAGASAYSRLYQKNVTAWLDLRNKAAHGKHNEYTKEQVVLMLQGVQDFAARFPA
jgi:hypothetical protein